MEYEHVCGNSMRKPGARGAHAEVDLFAISASVTHFIEQADMINATPCDVHAATYGRRNQGGNAVIGSCGRGVQRRSCFTRRHLVADEPLRITAYRCVVGEWRHRSGRTICRCVCAQAAKPTRGHLRITVEQHDIAVRMERHALVCGGDESAIRHMGDQGDRAGSRQLDQPGGYGGLRAGVVDDHDFRLTGALRAEHAIHAAAGFSRAAIDRYDNIDGCGRVRHGGAVYCTGKLGAGGIP